MNSAPEWQDGECCFRCRSEFSIVARKHHCRNCGNVFCAKCSSQQMPIPKFGIDKSVRVCDDCYENLTPRDSNNDPIITNGRPVTAPALDSISTTSSATISSTATATTAKIPAKASAPSEQELKEEEEIQLALALSLSEAEAPRTSAKISFPDFKQIESQPPIILKQTKEEDIIPTTSTVSSPFPTIIPSNPTPEDEDRELFRFVAELQSNAEVFVNRINSNKLRGRPIANDTAIQAKFLSLTEMHSKLLSYIKDHEEQRAFYEGLQDKLTQIHDARAALDALREEHQEKIRLAAEEAERNRQNQLAHKLELMRQKKSEMLQYQRDMAMQRMQEQEMSFMIRQDNPDLNNIGTTQAPSQAAIQTSTQMPMQISTQQTLQTSTQIPIHTPTQISMQMSSHAPVQTSMQMPAQLPMHAPIQAPMHSRAQISMHASSQLTTETNPTQLLPPPVVDEAPLISFDD